MAGPFFSFYGGAKWQAPAGGGKWQVAPRPSLPVFEIPVLPDPGQPVDLGVVEEARLLQDLRVESWAPVDDEPEVVP